MSTPENPETPTAPAQESTDPPNPTPAEITPAQAKAEADAARAAGDDVGAIKAEARKWEAQAKANAAAAARLAEIEEASKSEAEKAAERLAAAEAKVKEYETRQQLAEWKSQVSQETGVPAAVLAGTTLEDLQAHAEALKPLISKEPTPAPYIVPTEGSTPGNAPASQLTDSDIAQMTPAEINAARKAGRLNKLLGIS